MTRKLCISLGILLAAAVSAFAVPPATYTPRSIKELDDARGVSLSLKFMLVWDGTKFAPRFVTTTDVNDSANRRYITDAQRTVLQNTSGTNTGDQDLSGYVPATRTVNGHALSSNVTIAYGDLDGPFPTLPSSIGPVANEFVKSYTSASGIFTTAQPAFSDLSGTPTTLAGYGIADAVPSARTVNGHPLSANVTVAYSELGGPFPTFPANTGATANQFFTAYADASGLFSKAQPAIANLSDAGTLATWAGITPGTGVGTALAVNVGTAGAFVTKDGALGTPTSGTLTNATGLPPAGVTGTAAILGANTFTGAQANSYTSTASTPAMYYTGTWLTGGTGTTNFPHLLLQATGTTASTTWSTAGTGLGANAVTGFTGNLIDLQLAGTSKFKVSSTGAITATSLALTNGGAMTDAGTGAITLTASGTNQPITLKPSGTGSFIIQQLSDSPHDTIKIFDSGSNILAKFNQVGTFIWMSGSSERTAIANSGQYLASDVLLKWQNGTNLAASGVDAGIGRNAAGVMEVNSGTLGTFRDIKARTHVTDSTITGAGTTGAQTINKSRGTVRFAAASSTLVVTNSLVASTSKIIARGIGAFDATATNFQCTAASGSFTITANAVATAETEVLFDVMIP